MFHAFAVNKYLQDLNYEDVNNFKLAQVDGKVVICEWEYEIDPPDISNLDERQLRIDFGIAQIRRVRNDILDMTDKFLLPDSPVAPLNRTNILIPYRQSLRDITTNIRNGSLETPIVGDDMKVSNRANIFPVIPTMPGNYLKFIQARYRWMRYAGDFSK